MKINSFTMAQQCSCLQQRRRACEAETGWHFEPICAWRTFSPLSSVCDWISVSSIFCSLFAVLACACREHRTTCFKAGNDCVRHSIEDDRFTVLIPILKTCYLPRIVRGLFACLFYSPGEEVTFYRNQTWMSKTHSTNLLYVCMP